MSKTRKNKRPTWVRGAPLDRQLGLLRWLAKRREWVSTKEMAAHTYGTSVTQRRALHRDLLKLRGVGVPIEQELGWWRLRASAFNKWLRDV